MGHEESDPTDQPHFHYRTAGFPGDSDSKESAHNVRDLSSVPGLGSSTGKGNDYPLQCSCLQNSMDRGAWWATVYGVAKSQILLYN